jgi:hypothetical protein
MLKRDQRPMIELMPSSDETFSARTPLNLPVVPHGHRFGLCFPVVSKNSI